MVEGIDPDAALRQGRELPWGGKELSWGAELTREFTHWIEEQRSWRETVCLGDMTYMLNLHAEGPDALEMFADHSINNFDNFEVGQTKHAVQCNQNGKMISEGLLQYLDEEEFAIQGFPTPYFLHLADSGDYDVEAEVSDANVYEVLGPNAPEVMEAVTTSSVRDVNFMHLQDIEIGGHDVVLLRHSLAGVIGFELHVPAESADEVWNTIYEAGLEYGIREVGVKTWYTTRLESGLPQGNLDYIPALFKENHVPKAFSVDGSYQGDDISDWYRSPVEFNWGNYVDDEHDYPGKEALLEEVENPRRKLVTLVWDDEDVIDIYASLFRDGETYKFLPMPTKQTAGMRADEVRRNGELVGVSTNPGYLYHFREVVSLCTIDVEHAEPGTDVTLVWGEGGDPVNPMVERHAQKEIAATVEPAPYEAKERRADLSVA